MVNNNRTISSLLAADMKYEGTLRDFYCKNDVYTDAWHYAMLRRDYFNVTNKNSFTERRFTINDVIEIVSSVLTEETINCDSSMSNSLSWDSFSHMSIMIAISEQMNINLSPAEVTTATSVKAITYLITKVDPVGS